MTTQQQRDPVPIDTGQEPTSVALRQHALVVGGDPTERNRFIENQMKIARTYLEQPDAVFDFNEHARKNARKNYERQAEAAKRQNKSIEPFDESKFPPQLHIKANTWSRLASLYDLDIELIRGGWVSDPGWPKHQAYQVEAIARIGGREVGRSLQYCSFAEQQGERRRWNDSAQVVATAETRARSRAISQAIQWAIPFAYQTSTPEEMPAQPTVTADTQDDGFERPARRSTHPDLGAHSPHLRGGQNINPNFQGQVGNTENPHAAVPQADTPQLQATEQERPASQPTPEPSPDEGTAADAGLPFDGDETTGEIMWPYPPAQADQAALKAEAEIDPAFNWAYRIYVNCTTHKLLPILSREQWQEVCPVLMEASNLAQDVQAAIVTTLRGNPIEHAADPMQPWLFSFDTGEAN